jgi:TRAP transporter TAXI family solute receptor
MKTVLAALALILGVASGASAQLGVDKPITIGAGQAGSQNYAANTAIGKLLAEKGINTRVQSYGGAGNYLALINVGDLDFAAITSPEVVEAMNGTGHYAGKKQEKIRIAARLSPTLAGLFVKKDSPIKRVRDLKGKRVPWGWPSQPTLIFQFQSMLANDGLTADDVQKVMVPSVVRGVDEYVQGKTDVVMFALSGGRLVEADSQLGGVRFLPMADTPEAVQAMQKFTPGSYVMRIDPRPGQIGIAEPTNIMAYHYLLVVGMHVPDALIVRVLTIITENEKVLNATPTVLRMAKAEEYGRPVANLAYHPAAIRYYTETGRWPYKG